MIPLLFSINFATNQNVDISEKCSLPLPTLRSITNMTAYCIPTAPHLLKYSTIPNYIYFFVMQLVQSMEHTLPAIHLLLNGTHHAIKRALCCKIALLLALFPFNLHMYSVIGRGQL